MRQRGCGRRSTRGPGLLASFAQDPLANRNNEAAVFGDRHEVGRTDEPALRMLPADQRFGAGQRSGFEIDLRLVVEQELALGERAMQADFDPLPLDGPCVRFEELKNVPATFLGVVHRGVRALDQLLRIRTVVGVDADPDRGGDMQIVMRIRRIRDRLTGRQRDPLRSGQQGRGTSRPSPLSQADCC